MPMYCSLNTISGLRRGWASLVGNTVCVLPRIHARKVIILRPREALCVETSLTLIYVFLLLANFNLYPFPVRNSNHEHNSFQWSSVNLCRKLLNQRVVLETTRRWCQKWGQSGMEERSLISYSLANCGYSSSWAFTTCLPWTSHMNFLCFSFFIYTTHTCSAYFKDL